MWTSPPHLAGDTGLSRYYDFGAGPAPEALKDENDIYKQVAEYFVLHPARAEYEALDDASGGENLPGAPYSVQVCGARGGESSCEPAHQIKLKADYYKGDRSMRESGFDVSFRFGPYGAETHHYAPVCLNSLLYKTEKDFEQMSNLLGHPEQARNWQARAAERQQRMMKYFWDEREGLFFDYNFVTHKRSEYEYATTFYPLWAGLASKAQAQA